ncbi:MAG: hypothetical protein JNK87_25150 [Bryobacterales bacterium]|nr:hypothetical protein [Bryobacterales bacterium]
MLLFLLTAVALLPGQPPYRVLKQGGHLVREDSGAFALPAGMPLRLTVPGEVTVRGGAGPRVSYRILTRFRPDAAPPRAPFGFLTTQNAGVLHAWLPGRARDAAVELTVPASTPSLVVRVGDGAVTVTGLSGNVQVQAGAGAIRLDQIGGRIQAETGGGPIQVGVVDGPVDCRTGGGGITLRRARSSCALRTEGGEVAVQEAGGPLRVETQGGNIQIWRALSTVEALAAGGLVEVNQAAGRVVARVGDGGIHIGNAVGADCRLQAGTIRLDTVRGALHAVTGRGEILAQWEGPLEDSRLLNGEGDITVVMPSNLRATVQAKSQAAGTVGGIVTDFHQLLAPNWFWLFRPPDSLAARLNGGGPRLVVSTTGGVIYLKKQKTE